MRVGQYSRKNPALYGRSSVLVCPACDMPSFAPCLHEEADTRIFGRTMEAAEMPNKKISSFISCIFPPKGLTEMTQHLALSQFIITEVSSDQISHLF